MKPLATLLRDFHARLLELEAADGESVSGSQVLAAFEEFQREALQVKPPAEGQVWQNSINDMVIVARESRYGFVVMQRTSPNLHWEDTVIETTSLRIWLAENSYTMICDWSDA